MYTIPYRAKKIKVVEGKYIIGAIAQFLKLRILYK